MSGVQIPPPLPNLNMNFKSKKPIVLFLCRDKCSYSLKAYKHLLNKGWIVKKIVSDYRNNIPKSVLNWKGDYIFSFRSYIIIPEKTLKNTSKAAINFHPSPPKYRGSGGINFAIYKNEKIFGCTAHLMNNKIDNGKIISVRRFDFDQNANLLLSIKKTHYELLNLFKDIINGIYKNDQKFIYENLEISKNIKWGNKLYKTKDIDELQKIDTTFSKKKIQQIINATHIDGHYPYINVKGFKFILKDYKS